MNRILTASLAAGLTLATANMSYARDDGPIVVQSETAMQQWARDTTRKLDRQLKVGSSFKNLGAAQGIVQIRFQQDEEGRPINLELRHSSGNPTADRTAQWAVRRLRNLDEVPVSNARGATFQANIIFAFNEDEKGALEQQLAGMERKRLASNAAEGAVISLGS